MLPESKPRGFTRIELVTVVAVLGALAAGLAPVFVRARDRARQAPCLCHLRQLAAVQPLTLQHWNEQLAPRPRDGPRRPESL